MLPKVFFRVDGNPEIGLGHLVRCIALANMLKNYFEISFFCREFPETIKNEFDETGFGLVNIQFENEFFAQLTEKIIVVLDGYDFDIIYQKNIKSKGCSLVCIDDLHDKEFVADLIINHSPGINPHDYRAQTYTRFALGLEYSLLRPAFLAQAKKTRVIKKIETIMICFGGSDPKNLTQSTIDVAIEFPEFKKIIVVTGAQYKVTKSFDQLIDSDTRVDHRINLNELQMCDSFLEADLAIIPSSGVCLEAICCGCIPLICYYVKNQNYFHDYLTNNYSFKSFGNNTDIFQKKMLQQQLLSLNNYGRSNALLLKDVISQSTTRIREIFQSRLT